VVSGLLAGRWKAAGEEATTRRGADREMPTAPLFRM